MTIPEWAIGALLTVGMAVFGAVVGMVAKVTRTVTLLEQVTAELHAMGERFGALERTVVGLNTRVAVLEDRDVRREGTNPHMKLVEHPAGGE